MLIDARRGVLEQSKRHAFISALLGIPEMVVAINKMDLVDHSRQRYEELVADFETYAASLPGVGLVTYIPLSALDGDNVVHRSEAMSWYDGPGPARPPGAGRGRLRPPRARSRRASPSSG